MDVYQRSNQKSSKLNLILYVRFLMRWGWFIVLSLLVTTVTTYLLPDVTTPLAYQASFRIQIPLPPSLDGTRNLNNSTGFFSSLFVSTPTLRQVLSQYPELQSQYPGGLQLSDLQSLVTTAPVSDTNYFTLSATGATSQAAITLVRDVYNATLAELHAKRSEIDTQLTSALNAELRQTQNDAASSLSTLQNLTAEHLQSSSEYLQVESLYNVQIQRINSINQQLLLLKQQDFGPNDILRLGSSTPDITSLVGPEATQGQRLALSPLVGLIMGLGGILLARTFSNELPLHGKKREIVLSKVIATIPLLPGIHKRQAQALKVATPCLALLQLLQFQASDVSKQFQIITVTSPSRNEGKSIVATGLAFAAAQSGLRTLLIDANPQRPVLHDWFQLSNASGTLDTIHKLTADSTSRIPICHSFEKDLGIIPIGNKKSQAYIFAEELPIHHLRRFTEVLRKHAECIIFDGPPILHDANATNLVQLSDKTLFIVDALRSKSPDVIEAERLLSISDASFAMVLNRANSVDWE